MEEIIIELRSWFRTNGLMDFELYPNKIPKDKQGKFITYECKDVEEQFKIAIDKLKKLPIHNVSQQREQLIAFQKFIQTQQAIYFLEPEENADNFIKAINCG